MTRQRFALTLGALLLAGALAGGCKDDQPTAPVVDLTGAVPAFSLTDVNPTSPTADQPVSPRDHLRRVSAWYFGHST